MPPNRGAFCPSTPFLFSDSVTSSLIAGRKDQFQRREAAQEGLWIKQQETEKYVTFSYSKVEGIFACF